MKTQDNTGYGGYIHLLDVNPHQIGIIASEFSKHPKGIPVEEFKGLVKKVRKSDEKCQWYGISSGTVKANGATYVERVYGGRVYRILDGKVHEVSEHCGAWLSPKPN